MRECATLTSPSSLIHPTAHRRIVSFDVPAGMRRAALNSKCSHTVLVPGKTSS